MCIIKCSLLVVALCVTSKPHVVLVLMLAREFRFVNVSAGTAGSCS